jgi:hypothetical protein
MRLIGITALIMAIGFTASAGCQTATSGKAGSVTDRPAEASQKSLFDRLVGTWDVDYEIYGQDGSVRRYKGQAVYSWILDGSAVQEIWTSDAHNKTPQPYSTTIDFYDKKRQSWTVVWIYPAQGVTTIVTGGETDGRILFTGHDQAGAMQRWSATDIQPDSFLWRYESSKDEGKSWQLLGVNHMHRHRT